jgi:RNA polymerase sigma factor (sigma-70 family)
MRQYLRVLSGSRNDPPQADGQLLERYVAERDEAAFAALVDRYGPLVLGVCNRVLQDPHAAEDAFQATFLVLARRAPTLDGQGPLGNWLYAVAYRTAVKARQNAARRRAHERQVLEMPAAQASEDKTWDDLRPLLDEELNQLPEKYRAPLVLCFLEGKSHQEAARELGWPSGSMSRRMARARELLKQRLARRGLALSTGLLFALIAGKAKAAVVAAPLAAMTTRAAVLFGAGKASAEATVAAHVASLAEEVLRSALTTKAAKGSGLVLTLAVVGVIGLTGGMATYPVWAALLFAAPAACSTTANAAAKTEANFYGVEELRALALTSDGTRLATGGDDRKAPLRLWTVADKSEQNLEHRGPVRSVAFSPDDRTLAAGGSDGTITLYDTGAGRQSIVLRGHNGAVTALDYAPDGKTLASAGQDGTVRLWDMPSGAGRAKLAASEKSLAAVAYSPDGKMLAAAGADGLIHAWDASSGRPLPSLGQKGEGVTSLSFSPSRNLLAAGTDKTVRVWDMVSRELRRTCEGHTAAVLAVAFSQDDNQLFSGDHDGVLRVWDLAGSEAGNPLPGHVGQLRALVSARNGSRLASGGTDQIKVWNVERR